MLPVRLHDPARKPEHWSGLIREGQFAVSHFDYQTGTWRIANGDYSRTPEEEVILLFDSFAEAESYCRAHVELVPTLFCRVYDHRGSVEGLVTEVFHRKIAEREHGPNASRRKIRNGLFQLSAGMLCVLVDWWWGGPVILGVVIGSKFLTSGVVRLVQGLAGQLEAR